METNEITGKILNAASKVHSTLGPGLLESACQACLAYELRRAGLRVEIEKPLPRIYDELKLECRYLIEIIVENEITVELKAVEAINEVHLAQILTYLKLSGKHVDCF